LEDQELVKKILQGDEQSKIEFYMKYREGLYKDCVYLLGHQDPEAEDVMQEAFIIAFKKLSSFEFRSSLETWLTRICVNLSYNRYRKRAKTVVREQADLEKILVHRSLDGERWKAQDEVKEAKLRLIEKGLEKISPECREILILRNADSKSYLEIGEMLKIPPGTVMSRLSRCTKALKVIVDGILKKG
jgi:RNA polymerase sigma-70 factor (ECF subfamily)